MFDRVETFIGLSTTISFAQRNSGAIWSIMENGMMTGLSTNAVRVIEKQSGKSVMMASTMEVIGKLLIFNQLGTQWVRNFKLTFRSSFKF